MIDIGANEGQFALSHCGATTAIADGSDPEPLHDAFQKLQAHAAADPSVGLPQYRLGEFDGKATINVSANSQSSSFLPVDPHSLVLEPSIAYIGKEEEPAGTASRLAVRSEIALTRRHHLLEG